MAEKVITKVSFIGEGHNGRLAYPGEVVDVDAKTGAPVPAGSTPIGNLTIDQLRAVLNARESEESPQEPVFGGNVADPDEANTGSVPLVMAPIRPGDGLAPQALPPGTVPYGDTFVRPAAEDAPGAVEQVVGPAETPAGGSAKAAKDRGDMNKAELLDHARSLGIEVNDSDTKAEINDKIDAAQK